MTATATKPIELFQYEACPFSWKVKVALQYKQLPFEAVEVHPLNKKEISFSKEYRKVPIVRDGENIVCDSTEILRFLDREYPERPIFESDVNEQAREREWLSWADNNLVQALPPVIYATIGKALKAFGYITKVGKFSWLQKRLIKYSGAIAMTVIAKKGAKKRNIQDPIGNFKHCLGQWERAIGSSGFFGETHPNAADLAVYGYLKAIQTLPAFSFVRENPRVYVWFRDMSAELGSV